MVTTVLPTSTSDAIGGASAGLLGIAAIAVLIVVLIVKELVASKRDGEGRKARTQFLSGILDAPILSLLVVFVIVVVVKVWEAL